MKPAKILYADVSPSPSYGGSKRVLANILTSIDRARWIPHVLYYRDGGYVGEVSNRGIWARAPIGLPGQRMEEEPGSLGSVPALDLRSRINATGVRRDPSGWVERSWPRRLARDARSLQRYWIRGAAWSRRLDPFLPQGIDLIHFNGPMHDQHYEWARLAGRLGIPYVTHEHGPWRIPPAAFRIVARHAAGVLCLTEERIGEVRRFCGRSVRADLVPNGVSVEGLTPRRPRDAVRAALGIAPQTLLLLTAAHIQAYKGQLLAVEAAGLLAGAGLDFHWILCGSHLEKEYVGAVEQRVGDLALEKKISILEERSDLPDLFAAADLLVHTSIGPEAFGMVVIEAMGAGTAVVAPAEGAVASIVRDGKDGLLCEPRDPEAMAAAILRLANAPELRKRMGESGRTRVIESYSVETQVKRLCAVYERALAGRRGEE